MVPGHSFNFDHWNNLWRIATTCNFMTAWFSWTRVIRPFGCVLCRGTYVARLMDSFRHARSPIQKLFLPDVQTISAAQRILYYLQCIYTAHKASSTHIIISISTWILYIHITVWYIISFLTSSNIKRIIISCPVKFDECIICINIWCDIWL